MFFPTMPEGKRERAIVISRSWSAEKRVRSVAHGLGLRFRLCDTEMPGHPHLVLPSRRSVVFVCSCRTYLHDCAAGQANEQHRSFRQSALHHRKRLEAVRNVLERRQWHVGLIWECQTKDPAQIRDALEVASGVDLSDRPLPSITEPATPLELPRLRSPLRSP